MPYVTMFLSLTKYNRCVLCESHSYMDDVIYFPVKTDSELALLYMTKAGCMNKDWCQAEILDIWTP